MEQQFLSCLNMILVDTSMAKTSCGYIFKLKTADTNHKFNTF